MFLKIFPFFRNEKKMLIIILLIFLLFLIFRAEIFRSYYSYVKVYNGIHRKIYSAADGSELQMTCKLDRVKTKFREGDRINIYGYKNGWKLLWTGPGEKKFEGYDYYFIDLKFVLH